MNHVNLPDELGRSCARSWMIQTSGVHSLTSCMRTMMHSKLASSLEPAGRSIRHLFSSNHAAADILDSWRNPAAVLHGANDLRLEDMPLPDQVAEGSVRVQMRSVGICGSDVHFMKHLSQQVVCTADVAAV